MRAVVGVVSLLLLAGCSSAPASNTASAPATADAPGQLAVAAPAAPLDAAGELAKLKAAGLPIGATGVVTAADDPNHLLGRPNGYTSKVYWTDTRVDKTKIYPSSMGGTDPGGAIESYADTAGVLGAEGLHRRHRESVTHPGERVRLPRRHFTDPRVGPADAGPGQAVRSRGMIWRPCGRALSGLAKGPTGPSRRRGTVARGAGSPLNTGTAATSR